MKDKSRINTSSDFSKGGSSYVNEMVAMNLRAVQLQIPNRELSREGENMKFIHIGCWPLNIANKSGARDEISQIRLDQSRSLVACGTYDM